MGIIISVVVASLEKQNSSLLLHTPMRGLILYLNLNFSLSASRNFVDANPICLDYLLFFSFHLVKLETIEVTLKVRFTST